MDNIYKKIGDNYEELSDREQEVIDFVLRADPIEKVKLKDITEELFISNTTIIRACKKLGFATFNEMKYAFIRSKIKKEEQQRDASELTEITTNIRNDMNTTLDLLDLDEVHKISEVIANARRVFCIGAGSSSQVASDFNHKLKLSNIWSNEYAERYAIRRIPTIVEKNDCVIIFSLSGNIDEIQEEMLKVKEKGIVIISFTTMTANSLSRMSDYSLSFYKSPSPRKKVQSRLMLNLVSNIVYEHLITGIPYVE